MKNSSSFYWLYIGMSISGVSFPNVYTENLQIWFSLVVQMTLIVQIVDIAFVVGNFDCATILKRDIRSIILMNSSNELLLWKLLFPQIFLRLIFLISCNDSIKMFFFGSVWFPKIDTDLYCEYSFALFYCFQLEILFWFCTVLLYIYIYDTFECA